eukprot:CAMPEP_0178932684 /NCGR_PEP_ID=MMETSP0786-20121207/22774_1 /TAXON_ID=186022 /ORGANISM="Thalassionema frauenfeldii, Strain CCMP 1798" /LENGTH=1112 /DNA_ID=CAMNT_0020610043 /DNA_START=136 /DNA_END=3472 /DNA_ORIENTATION=+
MPNSSSGLYQTVDVSGNGVMDAVDEFDFENEMDKLITPQSKPKKRKNRSSVLCDNDPSVLCDNDPLSRAQGANLGARPQSRHGNRPIHKKKDDDTFKFYESITHAGKIPKKKDRANKRNSSELTYSKLNSQSPSKLSQAASSITSTLRNKKGQRQKNVVDLSDDRGMAENNHDSANQESPFLNHPGMQYEDAFSGKDENFFSLQEQVNSCNQVVTPRKETNDEKNYEDLSPKDNSNSKLFTREDDEEIDSPSVAKHPMEMLTDEDAVCSPSKGDIELISIERHHEEESELDTRYDSTRRRQEKYDKKRRKSTGSSGNGFKLSRAGSNNDVKKMRKSTGRDFLTISSDATNDTNEGSLFCDLYNKRKRGSNEKDNREYDAGEAVQNILNKIKKRRKEERKGQNQIESTADAALGIDEAQLPQSLEPRIMSRQQSNRIKESSTFLGKKKRRGKGLTNTTLRSKSLEKKPDSICEKDSETGGAQNEKIERGRRRSNGFSEQKDGIDDSEFGSLGSITGFGRRKSPRLPKKDTKGSAQDAPIEIIDDSDEEDETQITERGEDSLDLARVTLGKKYSSSDCKLILEKDKFNLRYKTKAGSQEHTIHGSEVTELKFCIENTGEDDDLILLVLRAQHTHQNGLTHLAKFLMRNDENEAEELPKRGYIVLELRSYADVTKFISWVNKCPELHEYHCSEDNLFDLQVSAKDCQENYAAVMFARIEKDNENRRSSLRTRSSSRKKRNQSNETLVVFPFGGEDAGLDRAAQGLTEARQALASNAINDEKKVEILNGKQSDIDVKKAKARSHVLTIRDEDFERLDYGEFLNDTLIDFWMQWIMSKENRESSRVHIFSSHFYSSLKKDGTAAVESWTAKKNIDIFSKRFIFIPINESLHWSLCVVVNPSHIFNSIQLFEDGTIDNEETPASCILFLDSLKAHKKTTVAKHIRKWLNSEWKRLKDETKDNLYTPKTMRVFSPRIPYQDNSWDCGVFVCRYAFAIFMNRGVEVIADDVVDQMDNYIQRNAYFQFDMGDIERIRDELKTLITNLAVLYKDWSAEEIQMKAESKSKETKTEENHSCSKVESKCDEETPLPEGKSKSNLRNGETNTHTPAEDGVNTSFQI